MTQQTPTGLTTIQKRATDARTDFRSLLLKMKDQIALALPKHLTAERMLRVVLTTVNRTPALLNCTRESVLGAIMQCAQLGLEPDGTLGLAYLVPYGNQCQLIIGYKGMIELARRSDRVADIRAHVVNVGDLFEYELGLKPTLRHIPADMLQLQDREAREKALKALGGTMQSPLIAAYAVVDLKDGRQHFEVISKSFVDRIKAVSKSASSASSPWKQWEDQMWKKTAIKQVLKYVPLSPEDRAIIETADERTIGSLGDVVTADDAVLAQAEAEAAAQAAEQGAAQPADSNGGSVAAAATASAPKRTRTRRATPAPVETQAASAPASEPAAAPPPGPEPPVQGDPGVGGATGGGQGGLFRG